MASSFGRVREEVAPSLRDVAARVASGFRSEASETDEKFPRSRRLTSRRQFAKVYNGGRKARRRSFTIFGLANDVGHCRLGLTVTRRAGSAVTRNRIKRVLRDAFRRQGPGWPESMDLVINAYPEVLTMDRDQLRRELLAAVATLADGRRR